MKATLQHNLEALNVSSLQHAHFLGHMHFAVTPIAKIDHWLEQLLAEWTSPRKVIGFTSQAGELRLSAFNVLAAGNV